MTKKMDSTIEFIKAQTRILPDEGSKVYLVMSNSDDYMGKNLDKISSLAETNPELFSSIQHINYTSNKATNIDWVRYFPKLTSINYLNNSVTTLSWIKYAVNVTSIICTNNGVTNIDDLVLATNLEVFYGNDNLITELPDITNLKNLTFIAVHNCQIKELVLRSHLTLKKVDCSYNPLETVVLGHLPELVDLKYNSDRIKEIYVPKLFTIFLDIVNKSEARSEIFDYSEYDVTDPDNMCGICMSRTNRKNAQRYNSERPSMCMEDYLLRRLRNTTVACVLTKCQHLFHKTCLDTWLSVNNTCPICRYFLQ